MTSSWTCRTLVEALGAGSFHQWQGLARACKESLLAAFPADPPGEGRTSLGSEGHRVAVLMRRVPNQRHPLEVQLLDGEMVRADLESPALTGSLPDLLEALGEPTARLPYYWGAIEIEDGQWLWPGRGLALYLDDSRTRVNRLAVFAPTDVAGYQHDLEPDLRIYEE